MQRAAIYARVSTTDQADNGTSLDTQSRLGIAFARNKGYEVKEANIYYEDRSGFSLDRPELNTLRSKAKADEIDVIICYALDRLSRNQVHQSVLFYELEEQLGKRLEFVTEDMDDSPEGHLLRSVRGFVAEQERAKIQERTTRGKRERVNRGSLPNPGKPKYGYRLNDERTNYVIDESSASVVRLIFSMASEQGMRSRAIALKLNDMGIPTRGEWLRGLGFNNVASSQWYSGTVLDILHDRSYTGEFYAYGLKSMVKRQRNTLTGEMREYHTRVLMTGTDRVLIRIPALISEETYEAAQSSIKETERATKGYESEIGFLRGGFAVCGYCGRMMSVYAKAEGVYAYRCSSYTRNHHIDKPCPSGSGYNFLVSMADAQVWGELVAFVEQSELFVQSYEKLLANQDARKELVQSTLNALNTNLERERRKKSSFIMAIGNAEGDEVLIRELTENVQRCKAAIVSIEDEIIRSEEAVAGVDEAKQQLQQTRQYLAMATSVMNLASFEERRAFLRGIGARVKMFKSSDLHEGKRYEISLDFVGVISTTRSTTCKPCNLLPRVILSIRQGCLALRLA